MQVVVEETSCKEVGVAYGRLGMRMHVGRCHIDRRDSGSPERALPGSHV